MPGLKSAVVIKGTLNNYGDIDDYWQLEVAIPFGDLSMLEGRPPVAGDEWLFHLAPSLIITKEEIDMVVDLIDQALAAATLEFDL